MASVFIVDDEPFLHVLYHKMLERHHHELAGDAFSGDEAIGILEKLPKLPDFIIMDHFMPGRDGLDTTRLLLADHPELRVILVSGDGSCEEPGRRLGVYHFLEKPFSMEELGMYLDSRA